jgi:hypothetical protein
LGVLACLKHFVKFDLHQQQSSLHICDGESATFDNVGVMCSPEALPIIHLVDLQSINLSIDKHLINNATVE